MPRSLYQRMEQPADDGISKLLGPLEVEIMEVLWTTQTATVRDVATRLNETRETRPLAYSTVMTIMNNLADKGLLGRTPLDKRTHLYEVRLTRDAFVQQASERVIRALITDFGDVALTQFAQALEEATPEQRARIKRRLKEQAARGRKPAGPVDGP